MKKASLENVYFRYQEENPWTLENIDADIEEGEWLSIIGSNGSGKSTLSRLFNGLLSPVKGTVKVGGKCVQPGSQLPDIRRQVGMVFQNPDHQFVAPTVRDDIAFGMENAGISREEMLRRIEVTSRQTGIEEILDVEPYRLSGGQKQRAAIAGALVLHPEVLVLDEATSMLDPYGRQEVISTLKALHRREGVTLITVTHDLREALMGDRIWFLESGKITFNADSDMIIEHLSWLKNKIPLPYELSLLEELRSRSCKEAVLLEHYVKEGHF